MSAARSMGCQAELDNVGNGDSVARQVAEVANEADGDVKKFSRYTYPTMQKIQGSFTLDIEAGEFTDSEILVRCMAPAPGLAQQIAEISLRVSLWSRFGCPYQSCQFTCCC